MLVSNTELQCTVYFIRRQILYKHRLFEDEVRIPCKNLLYIKSMPAEDFL